MSHWIKRYRHYLWPALLVLIIFLIWHPFSRHTRVKSVAVVTTVPVEIKDMPVKITAVGTVESQQSVTLTPEVTGTITAIHFQAGDQVHAGQPLFDIESDTFKAAYAQAQATLQHDQAQAVYLTADANRYANLVKLEYVTRDQYEQASAAAKAQQALVKADQAALEQASIQLKHANIRAPITGKTGNYTVRIGDLVVADSTPLVTINQLSPLWIDFNLAQAQFMPLAVQQSSQPLTVYISTEDETTRLATGVLSFVDNTINTGSGTILLKARVDAPNAQLWPGQMVSVALVVKTLPKAMVIPLNAVQVDEAGSFVYVLSGETVMIKRITLAEQTKTEAVIANGLTGAERILDTIPPDLAVGDQVKTVP